MERHAGEHPRIGAVDVVPFVPLGETTMAECVELAREFGGARGGTVRRPRVPLRGGGHDAPAAEAGRRAARPVRGAEGGDRRPRAASRTSGRPRLHPTAGAVAVGARPFLIAYNINLDSTDLELAKRIARLVRESSGGLPRVQASGFWIEERCRAQVSMNLLDFAVDADVARLGGGPGRRGGRGRGDRRVRADRARAAGGPGRRGRSRRRERRPGGGATGRCGAVPAAARLLAAAGPGAAARGGARGGRGRRSSEARIARSRIASGPAGSDRSAGSRSPRWRAGCGGAPRRATRPSSIRPPRARSWPSPPGTVASWPPGRPRRSATGSRPWPFAVDSFERLDARRRPGHARPDRLAHAPRVRRHARGRVAAARPRRRLSGDPGRRRRHPLHRGRHPRRRGR